MKEEYLDKKDKNQSGNYNYLNIEQTKKNLKMFEKDIGKLENISKGTIKNLLLTSIK